MARRKLHIKNKNAESVDPILGDRLAAHFITRMMWKGKRSLSARIFYRALNSAAEKNNEPPAQFLQKVVEQVRPDIEVKSRRVGGSTYQIPIKVAEHRQEALAVRWIIDAARAKTGASMVDRLSTEFNDAYNNGGVAVKRKEEMHRMAESNKAYSHYRW